MKKEKLNSIVSMYVKPALESVDRRKPVMALCVDKSTLNKKVKYGVAREIITNSKREFKFF